MKIVVTPVELLENGLWERYCALTGTNPWAVREGLLDRGEQITVTESRALELGLVSVNENVTGRQPPLLEGEEFDVEANEIINLVYSTLNSGKRTQVVAAKLREIAARGGS